MSFKQDFLDAINTEAIIAGEVLMGTLGKHYYGGSHGTANWRNIANSPDYYVSRESQFLAERYSSEFSEIIGQGAHVYMLGTSDAEAIAFAKGGNFEKITIVDIVESVAVNQRDLLRQQFKTSQIEALAMDYQANLLPVDNAVHNVIVYPSSNVGNTLGHLNKHVTENNLIVEQLQKFKDAAQTLITLYDANIDAVSVTNAYCGIGHDKFVIDTFNRAVVELGIKGLNVNDLKRVPTWSPEDSALLHKVSVTRGQTFKLDGRKYHLFKKQDLYPGHSYKFEASNDNYSMNTLARKADWEPVGKEFRGQHLVMQAFQ